MKTEITLPDLGLLAMTRGMLGAGLGLLAAGRLSNGARRPLGWMLVVAGVLTTIPLAVQVLGNLEEEPKHKPLRVKPRKNGARVAVTH